MNVVRIAHFFLGVILTLAGAWITCSPTFSFSSSILLPLRSLAISVMTCGIYSLVGSVEGFSELFFTIWAISQLFIVIPGLLIITFLASSLESQFTQTIRILAILNGLVSLLSLPNIKSGLQLFLAFIKLKRENVIIQQLKSQAFHSLYDLFLAILMIGFPNLIISSSIPITNLSTAVENDAILLVRCLGIQLFVMIFLYFSSSVFFQEFDSFRWLSVSTRLSCQLLLLVLWVANIVPKEAFLGCLGDSFFAILFIYHNNSYSHDKTTTKGNSQNRKKEN